MKISTPALISCNEDFGYHVSAFVQKHLSQCLEQQDIRGDTDALITAVKNCVGLLAQTKINVAFSSTTCVYGVLVDQKIYSANIGDSRGVVLWELAGGKVGAISISLYQKTENPVEKEPILVAGGRVKPLPGQECLVLNCACFGLL
jgi:serine/threonine protein phosphatase PrpC